jgi:activating signal cointegrator complex subunit 3
VYIAPLKALARERLDDWRRKMGQTLGLNVVELTGDVTPDLAILQRADIIICTPEKWDGITRGWKGRAYVQSVELLIIDEVCMYINRIYGAIVSRYCFRSIY